jgi:multidrug resistance efflux pump
VRKILRAGRRRTAAAAAVVLAGAGTGGWVLTRSDEAAADSTPSTATVALETVKDTVDDTRLAADQTNLVAAENSLAEAREAVDDATLRATIRGTVTAVGVEVGDTVGSSSSGGAGGSASTSTATTTTSTAFSLVSTGSYVLDATVPAADVETLQDGLQAEITASGIDDTIYGTATSVGRVAETSSSGSAGALRSPPRVTAWLVRSITSTSG